MARLTRRYKVGCSEPASESGRYMRAGHRGNHKGARDGPRPLHWADSRQGAAFGLGVVERHPNNGDQKASEPATVGGRYVNGATAKVARLTRRYQGGMLGARGTGETTKAPATVRGRYTEGPKGGK